MASRNFEECRLRDFEMTSAFAQYQPYPPEVPDPAMLLAAVQVFPESLAIVASGLIVYANPAWSEMFECNHQQLQGRELAEFVPQHPLSIMFRAQSGPASEVAPETNFVLTRADGSRRHIEVASAGLAHRNRDFQVIRARDISRHRHTEEELREAQRLEAVREVGRWGGSRLQQPAYRDDALLRFAHRRIGERHSLSPPCSGDAHGR